MSDQKEVVLIPTVGYHTDTGAPRTFQLKEKEGLPSGWVDNPAKSKAGKEKAKADEAAGLA